MVTNNTITEQIETAFSGLGGMIQAEFTKLGKRQMTRVLLGILVAIVAIVNLLLLAIFKVRTTATGQAPVRITDMLGLPISIPFALSLLASFGVLLAIILTASSMGNEYNWKTVRTALISSQSRFKFLVAKLVSLGLLILIGMVIGVVTGLGLTTTVFIFIFEQPLAVMDSLTLTDPAPAVIQVTVMVFVP